MSRSRSRETLRRRGGMMAAHSGGGAGAAHSGGGRLVERQEAHSSTQGDPRCVRSYLVIWAKSLRH
eukprot:1132867-Prymnesium_polylepis.1